MQHSLRPLVPMHCLCTVKTNVIVAGGSEGKVAVWDLEKGELVQDMKGGHRKVVRCIATAGNTVVTGAEDEDVRLWDIRTTKCVNTLKGGCGWIGSVCEREGKIYAGDESGGIREWDARSANALHFATTEGAVNALAVQGSFLLSGSAVLTQHSPSPHSLSFHSGRITRIRSLPDSALLCTASWDTTIAVWRSRQCN